MAGLLYHLDVDSTAEITDELSAIAGVEGAELSVDDGDVTGVTVRLEADADADGVGRAVQEVMVRHGVRARLGTAQPPSPPGPGAPVVALADRVEEPADHTTTPVADDGIEGVSVTETAKGLEVSVSTADGRLAHERCRGGDEAVAAAVAIATAELFGTPEAELVEYRREQVAETEGLELWCLKVNPLWFYRIGGVFILQ